MSVLMITRQAGAAILTLNRPQQRNALDLELRSALEAAIAQVRDDPEVRTVVLHGAGENFCAGGDVRALQQTAEGSVRDVFEGRERIRRIHRWFEQLIDIEKPVIAAVEGVCFGGGLSLALACDYVLASPNASFCAVFARLGYVPDMGAMYLLPRAVGLPRAKELVFSARVVQAQEALAIGLVHTLCEGDVLAQALELASRFESAPAGALAIAKSVMNRTFESDREAVFAQEAMAQAITRESAFHQEAARRFLAKEPALFNWPAPRQPGRCD